MKSLVLSAVLGASVLSSGLTWSIGSEIDLGKFTMLPGKESKLPLSDLPIYAGVAYDIECKLSSLEENSHFRVGITSDVTQIWVNDCTSYSKREVTCAIAKNKITNFGFKRVYKTESIITLRNLDFTQTFYVFCVAKVLS